MKPRAPRAATILLALALLATALPASAETDSPYSPARWAGDLLFLSGQIGTENGRLVDGGIQAETRRVLEKIEALLAKHDATMSQVVKCTVMLDDIDEWAAMNEVYVQFFDAPRPARSALGASGLALGAKVEIECIAHVPGGEKK